MDHTDRRDFRLLFLPLAPPRPDHLGWRYLKDDPDFPVHPLDSRLR